MQKTVPFKQWLKERRKELDLTQQALADVAGCSIDTVKKIEAGTLRPSRQLAELLGAALCIEQGQLADFVQWSRSGSPGSAQAQTAQPIAGQAPAPSVSSSLMALTNLPNPATPMVGREQEVTAVRNTLWRVDTRLLTLTGPPGVGKTRLSLQAAGGMLQDFEDGAFFVALAPVTDPSLVASTIAQTLGIKETARQMTIDSLKKSLRNKRMLLVLDNFEQVISAAPFISELLGAAPHLKVLVSSREALHLYGEQEYPVPPLSLPESGTLPVESLAGCEAIELFVQRARAVRPDFMLNSANAEAVTEICRRLDGLALAIELAAARIKILPPQAILERLDNRLHLLTGGAQDLPDRQRTLRGALEWSYSLLDAGEQALFRALSVFTSGCTLEGASAVCGASGTAIDILEGASSLINKSLARQEDRPRVGPRIEMLETIREYGLEQLRVSGEEDLLRLSHLAYYLALAEEAEEHIKGAQQAAWLERLEAEHDNLRSALQWAQDSGELELGLRLAGALGRFWEARSYFGEGLEWLATILARAEGKVGNTKGRAKVLSSAGLLAFRQGDYSSARSLMETSLAIWRELGSKRGAAYALSTLGNIAYVHGEGEPARLFMEESLALFREVGDKRGSANLLANMGTFASRRGDYASARSLIEESVALQREIGDKRGLANCLHALGLVMYRQGHYARAKLIMEESLTMRRELGDKWGITMSLLSLGEIARAQRDYSEARALFEGSLSVSRETGDKLAIANTLYNLGFVAYREGKYTQATGYFIESMDIAQEQQYKRGIIECVEGLAVTARALGQTRQAVALLGAVEALLEAIGAALDPLDQAEYSSNVAAGREQLEGAEWSAAWAEGRAMSLEVAVMYALQAVSEG